jgi:hypothetical protein
MTLRWRSNWVTRPLEGLSNGTLDWGSVDMGGYVRLSQTVAGVIVAPRWASYSHHVVISDPSNSTNQQIIFLSRLITSSDITIVIKHHSVYHTVPKKTPSERVE